MKVQVENVPESLVKHNVADRLREQIACGKLHPGMRIIEGTWAQSLGVAQASVREAINLLAQDGFVTKAAGRSARVVNFSEQDVLAMFQLRGVLEGLAARLAAERGADASGLDAALKTMRHALAEGRPEEMLDGDLSFHLELCRMSENSFLIEHARRLLLPLFAFARIRVLSSGQDASVWGKDMEVHQRIVDLIKEGHPDIAEQYVRHALSRFGKNAYDNWEKRPPTQARKTRAAAISPPKPTSADSAGLADRGFAL